MELAIHFDRGGVPTFSTASKLKPRMLEGRVARTHSTANPLLYATGPEYRDRDELLKIIGQLVGLPVVTHSKPDPAFELGHPPGLIGSDVAYYEIGRVISAHLENDHAVAQIYVHDSGALAQIEDGISELSLGYQCVLDADRWQKKTTVNHLSFVKKARCGATCALRTDAISAEPCGCLAQFVPSDIIVRMPAEILELEMKVTLDEKSVAAVVANLGQPSGHADCICNSNAIVHTNGDSKMTTEELTKKLDEALAEIATLKTEITSLQASAVKADEDSKLAQNQALADLKVATASAEKLAGEIETIKADAQAKVDAAQSARADADNTAFAAAVDARVDLLADAAAVGIEDPKAKTDRELKIAIVKKVDEMDIEDAHTTDYVNGMYAGAMKRHTKAAVSVAEVRTAIVENNDAADKAIVNPYELEAKLSEAAEAKRKNRWR